MRKIAKSREFKRVCDVKYSEEKSLSPPALPHLPLHKPTSSLGNYQISHFPTSPLNPELEQRCNIFQVLKNMKSGNVRKEKIKIPMLVVGKIKNIRFEAECRKAGKIAVSADKEICCGCENGMCECEGRNRWRGENKISVNSIYGGKKEGLGSEDSFVVTKERFNKTKQEFLGKMTKRKVKKDCLDLDFARKILVITPFRSFSRNE